MDGDQIMASATAHSSQFTQSLLLFVSATTPSLANFALTHEFHFLVSNPIWNKVYPMSDKILLFTGDRTYDEAYP